VLGEEEGACVMEACREEERLEVRHVEGSSWIRQQRS
jgi:hypothetical protein